MKRHLRISWGGVSRTSRSLWLLEHGAYEGHRQTPLGDDRRLIERIEQFVQRAHVAWKAALQIARGFLRQIEAPHLRAQLERLALLDFIERAQLKDRARREARAQIRQCPREQRRRRGCRGNEAAAA